MARELHALPEVPVYSDEWFAQLYLLYGSVDELLRAQQGLPISFATLHRIADARGLVKSPGRHVAFGDTVSFFAEMALNPDVPLQHLHRSMPPSFEPSMATLHRINRRVGKAVVARHATALMVHPAGDPKKILVGKELSGNPRLGKREGDITIPMTFSRKSDTAAEAVLRVLQREVYTTHAAKGALGPESGIAKSIIPPNVSPVYHLNILDIRLSVYSVNLPEEYCGLAFSSYKLSGHRFFESRELISSREPVRMGVVELIQIYENRFASATAGAGVYTSSLNLSLQRRTHA